MVTPGTANGSRRGAQLFVHVIDHGARKSKDVLCFSDSEKIVLIDVIVRNTQRTI